MDDNDKYNIFMLGPIQRALTDKFWTYKASNWYIIHLLPPT